MKQFFKFMFASMFGVMIAGLLLFFIFIGIISSIVSASKDDEVATIEENSILYLKLDAPINDRGSDNPFKNFNFIEFQSEKDLGLNDILANIAKAKTDDNIKGIYLDISVIPAGIASVEEIRNALLDFKQSKKFIIAYSEMYTQQSYYLATVADKLYLNPEGLMVHTGLSAELWFFKKTLEKLGIEPLIFKHGKFKSAIEPLTEEKMSAANREQMSTLLGSIWNHLLEGESAARNISIEDLNKYADSLLIKNPQAAMQYKMVDTLRYKDQIIDELKQLTDVSKTDDLKVVTITKYKNVPKKRDGKQKGLEKDKVAVIYAQGSIVSGDGGDDAIGSERISKAIRKARQDDKIKAIVLRVNSGGGSALASDVIWREIILAKKVKPVVASFGDVAASGGYYIACAADTIVCMPTTITGSIGVFGVMLNMDKMLADKFGISTDRVGTNKYADIGSVTRTMSAQERAVVQGEVEKTYTTFITHVAEGRRMTTAQVDSIGQGRVWSGIDAKRIGLVDIMGGLDTAITIAAKMAKLENYRVVALPEEKNPMEKIMQSLGEETRMYFIENELGKNYEFYKRAKNVFQYEGIQTRMPFEFDIY